jgi:outer membrane protein assembly factor BamB
MKIKMISKFFLGKCILLLSIVNLCFAQQKTYKFEDLGKPIRSPLTIEFVTNDEVTGPIAWGGLTGAENNVLVGVHMKDGRLIEVDLTKYGKANALLLFKASERYIYLFTGKKGRFLKYDIRLNELKTVGEQSNAQYWMKKSYAIAPDGKIYVGTYPQASVTVLNPKTDEVKMMEKISANNGSEYVINPAADKDGIIYFPTGMKHGELWSYNPATDTKKQILTEKLMTYGPAQIWKGTDGKVYGKKGSTTFLCTEDKIVEGETLAAAAELPDNLNGDLQALYLNKDGSLVVKNQKTKEELIIKSTFEPSAHEVFSVGALYKGKLYGSGMKPGRIFTYDTNTGKIDDLGHLSRGKVQTYDILAYKDRLFTSSYTGGYVDVFNVAANGLPINPKPVADLHRMAKQERLLQLTMGPDGNIYSPTIPIKGFLGGTLVQINPESLKTKAIKDIVYNQSLTSVTAIKKTGELFITSSIQGGTSAKPTEKEAVVVIWNPATEKVTYTGKPITGATSYETTVLGNNGLIYGSSLDTIYVFDPLQKKVLTKTSFEKSPDKRASIVLSETLGKNGFVYGIDRRNGQLFCIDPATNKITVLGNDVSIVGARFAKVREDGYLYYPNHATLRRVKVGDR